MDEQEVLLEAWLGRVERAFQGKPVKEGLQRLRALVPPLSMDVEAAQRAVQELQRGRQIPRPADLAALAECIRTLRTPLFIQDGLVVDPAPLPDEPRWRPERWDDFRARSPAWIASVCRIDAGTGSRAVPHATGFLVAPRVLMTASHVVRKLSRDTWMLERGQCEIRFGQEKDRPDGSGPVSVLSVLAYDKQLDVALLEIDPPPAGLESLILTAAQPEPEADVVTIGYPREDPDRNLGIGETIFRRPFDVKRAAPGEVVKVRGRNFLHDCCTLGGNSGSPVFDVATGRVLGVHTEGMNGWHNSATLGEAILEKQALRAHIRADS